MGDRFLPRSQKPAVGKLPRVLTGDEMSAFLIDARFLLRNTTETFWGAPLIVVDGKDNTFCYGFMRDLLRLRSSLHISAGAMVFGSDACSLASEKEIRSVVDLCRELGVVVIWEPKVPVLAIVATHADRFSNIVTDDRRMLCFCTERRAVHLGKDTRSVERVTPDEVQSSLGVPVQHVPTYLALTDGRKQGQASSNAALSTVTALEARRLIELYGALPSIYQHLSEGFSLRRRFKSARLEARVRRTGGHAPILRWIRKFEHREAEHCTITCLSMDTGVLSVVRIFWRGTLPSGV